MTMEADVLFGRRGIRGWDGSDYDEGLLLVPSPEPPAGPPSAWQLFYDDPAETLAYLAMGALFLAAAGAITAATGGLGGLLLGGVIGGFGFGYGATGAATHDVTAALQAGAIGGIAGAAAGAAFYGGATLAAVAMGFGGAISTSAVALASRFGGVGAQVAMSATGLSAAGAAGGFVGGTLGARAAGQSWPQAVYSGVLAGAKGALVGAAVGAAVPVVIRGAQLAGRGARWAARRVAAGPNRFAGRELKMPTQGTLRPGDAGVTSWQGDITIQRGMSWAQQREALLHESVHRTLTARHGPLVGLRQGATELGYTYSHFLRGTEEMLAHGYTTYATTGSLSQGVVRGLTFPFTRGYVNPIRYVLEAAAYAAFLRWLRRSMLPDDGER